MQTRTLKRLPQPLRLFLTVLTALAVASVLDAACNSWSRGAAAWQYLWQAQPGVDFYIYALRMPMLHSPAFFTGPAFPWMYPAPAIFFYYPFYPGLRPTHWHANFVVFLAVTGALTFTVARELQAALTARGLASSKAWTLLAGVSLLGWPLFFAVQRGNFELLLWLGVAAGVTCFARGRPSAAALLLGFFGSAKLYPLLLLGLFVRPWRPRQLVIGIATAAVSMLAALRFLEPDVQDAWRQIRDGVQLWTKLTTLKYWPTGVGPDHSILGLLREATAGAILRVPHLMNLYLVIAGLLAAGVFLLRVRRLPAPNQLLFLVCAAILLPPTSFDYTLLLLLIPWAWVVLLCVEDARTGNDVRRFRPLMVLFAVALAPMTFLHTYGAVQLYFEGPVRCLALLGLAQLAAGRPLPSGGI